APPARLVRLRWTRDARHDRRRKMLQALEPMEGILGLDGDGLDRGVVLLQPSRRAHERSRGAEARHEVCDAAFGLLEDLDGGAFVMRAGIRRVGVLVWIEIVVW